MPFDRLLAHQIGDPLDQLRLVDLIRNLGDDDRRPVALLAGLDRRPRAHHDRAAAGRVRLHDAAAADDEAAGREVRAGNQADQLPELLAAGRASARRRSASRRCVFSISQMQPSMHLAQVVRRDVGRHADGDARPSR